MTVLHLGVIDIPYITFESLRDRRQRLKKNASTPGVAPSTGLQTTGDVAGYLENDYGIMRTFYTRNRAQIVKELENSFAGAVESIAMGAPPTLSLTSAATSKIEDMFHRFLERGEMEGLGIPGVPTEAAKRGVNHRLKIKRGARRPSFIDTGLYDASFKAWVD